MSRSRLYRVVPWLGSIGFLVICADRAPAQSADSSLSSAGSYFGGGFTYVPFSGAMGGFIPYSSGPGGGLGVQTGMRDAVPPPQSGGMRMLGSTRDLGRIGGTTTPLAPLGIMNRPGMGGSGMSGGLIRRTPSGGRMEPMRRAPVGSYPFRIPPSLLGPGTTAPAMSM